MKLNMINNKIIFGVIFALLVLTSFVVAEDLPIPSTSSSGGGWIANPNSLVSEVEIEINGEVIDIEELLTLNAGETIPLRVSFIAEKDGDAIIKLEIDGLGAEIFDNTERFKVESGKHYSKNLSIELPENIVTSDVPFYIRFSVRNQKTKTIGINTHINGFEPLGLSILNIEDGSIIKGDYSIISAKTKRNAVCEFRLRRWELNDYNKMELLEITPFSEMSETGGILHLQPIQNLEEIMKTSEYYEHYEIFIVCRDQNDVRDFDEIYFYVDLTDLKEKMVLENIGEYLYSKSAMLEAPEGEDDFLSAIYLAFYENEGDDNDNLLYTTIIMEFSDENFLNEFFKEINNGEEGVYINNINNQNVYFIDDENDDVQLFVWPHDNLLIYIAAIADFEGMSDINDIDNIYLTNFDTIPLPLVEKYLEKYPSSLDEYLDYIPVHECGALDVGGRVYVLQNDIISSDYCFSIEENNITLDLKGYSITGDNIGNAIKIKDHDSLIAMNGVISNFSEGIEMINSNNNIIKNIEFYNNNNNREGDIGKSSIYLEASSNNLIKDNLFDLNDGGIYIMGGSENYIINNIITSSLNTGIVVNDSDNNEIINNTLINNNLDIYIEAFKDSQCNQIFLDNIGANNKPIGFFNEAVEINSGDFSEIILCNADDSVISNVRVNNDIQNNGIFILRTENSDLSNIFVNNSLNGISLMKSSNNIIKNSSISNNKEGIILFNGSDSNEIINNHIENNELFGLRIDNSKDNLIYNNFFKNIKNIEINGDYFNVFNALKTPETNIVNGPKLGGNYWANPDGTGYTEVCEDINFDGFCDSGYYFDKMNFDNLPLSNKFLDIVSPTIQLNSPSEGYFAKVTSSKIIDFRYIPDDGYSEISSCNLIVNGMVLQTDSTITKGFSNSFTKTLDIGTYEWKIKCVDSYGNEGFSEMRELSIKKKSSSSGSSSDSSSTPIITFQERDKTDEDNEETIVKSEAEKLGLINLGNYEVKKGDSLNKQEGFGLNSIITIILLIISVIILIVLLLVLVRYKS